MVKPELPTKEDLIKATNEFQGLIKQISESLDRSATTLASAGPYKLEVIGKLYDKMAEHMYDVAVIAGDIVRASQDTHSDSHWRTADTASSTARRARELLQQWEDETEHGVSFRGTKL